MHAVDPHYDMVTPSTQQGFLDSLGAFWQFLDPESYLVEYKVDALEPLASVHL